MYFSCRSPLHQCIKLLQACFRLQANGLFRNNRSQHDKRGNNCPNVHLQGWWSTATHPRLGEDLGPNNDLYTPFSGSGREWLSNNHISKCVLYMLHVRYPDAKHQNTAGVTHPVQELLHKVKQANTNSPLEYSTDISQAMRDALSPDGPSPAITFGDNIHWRVLLINARRKHVDFVDPFGIGFLGSVRTSVQEFYQRDNTGIWMFTEWTKRLKPRGDTWNCGIWAIWIQEKWRQYWSRKEATEACADWLQQDTNRIPEGQDLRQHYYVVMQVAGTAAEGGTTDLYQSRETSASRWQSRGISKLYMLHTKSTCTSCACAGACLVRISPC